MRNTLKLFPLPKNIIWLPGRKPLASTIKIINKKHVYELEKVPVAGRLNKALSELQTSEEVMEVIIEQNTLLPAQGYVLQWNETGLLIQFNEIVGLHYALTTFEQMVLRHGFIWDYFRINDSPDFLIRGFMLDIGRNKIPKMKTLYMLIDEMAKLKLNHLQLHMEGYAFQYEKYRDLFPESTPITAKEFQQLDCYAKERFIDLVPNQNCFGHMGDWLSKPELSALAEHPDGMATPYDITVPPVTLNPLDEKSIELVSNLFDELLPNFSSGNVNINFDEPFGLGSGKSKVYADKVGVGTIYLEFANKVFDIVRKHNKQVYMWGDILTSYPETITQLPDDVTVLDWNYDGHKSFAENASYYDKVQVPYIVCCGTSSWSSVSGRTENMIGNITDAAVNGKKYNAQGLIVTDWGDNGHWQVLPISFPGMVYGAGASWQVDENVGQETAIEDYLSSIVFQDANNEIGHLLMQLGRYYHYESSSVENATFMNHLLNNGVSTPVEMERKMNTIMQIFLSFGGKSESFTLDFDYPGIRKWLETRKQQVLNLDLQIPDESLVKAELVNTIHLVEHAVDLYRYNYQVNLQEDDKIKHVTMLKENLEVIIDLFNSLWLQRNRAGGLEKSNKAMYRLLEQYKTILAECL